MGRTILGYRSKHALYFEIVGTTVERGFFTRALVIALWAIAIAIVFHALRYKPFCRLSRARGFIFRGGG